MIGRQKYLLLQRTVLLRRLEYKSGLWEESVTSNMIFMAVFAAVYVTTESNSRSSTLIAYIFDLILVHLCPHKLCCCNRDRGQNGLNLYKQINTKLRL
jgi:hypothetical protein